MYKLEDMVLTVSITHYSQSRLQNMAADVMMCRYCFMAVPNFDKSFGLALDNFRISVSNFGLMWIGKGTFKELFRAQVLKWANHILKVISIKLEISSKA